MSNTRRARWTHSEVTAANAEQLLLDAWAGVEAEALRQVITDMFVTDLEARGHPPGLIAAIEQDLMELGDDYWLQVGREEGILPL